VSLAAEDTARRRFDKFCQQGEASIRKKRRGPPNAPRRVGKRFAARPRIEDLSMRIMHGDRIGLIGPNGAGKSTLAYLRKPTFPGATAIAYMALTKTFVP
jgi:ABC-type polysaccharide/polyol phosphate transport system ATPase subunit